MAEVPGQDLTIQSKRKAVSTLFPYAVRLAQGGQQGMMKAILRVTLESTSGGFVWCQIERYITSWFDESSPPSLYQAITLVSPCADWQWGPYTRSSVARWAAAVSATPYSEAVGQRVVDVLLQIAHNDFLQPHIPIEIWAWLKRKPSLPPICRGRYWGTNSSVVRYIRGLGDVEILKSYFLVVWSEWGRVDYYGFDEMERIIRGEFCGNAMQHHREDLTERLDHVLAQLDRGLEYFTLHNPRIDQDVITRAKGQYGGLREALVEVGRCSMETLPGGHPTLILSNKHTDSCGCVESSPGS
jgi:hypothetical protein